MERSVDEDQIASVQNGRKKKEILVSGFIRRRQSHKSETVLMFISNLPRMYCIDLSTCHQGMTDSRNVQMADKVVDSHYPETT
uniref:Uncharacterized protein n=1 Tax=Timema genevievae TaxID=629358 RepID=A0A7R9JV70_TIMGE|nr:unnamed protein product [Timema genevievae]